LLDTWPKSSSVNSINLVKKSATIPDIEFFLGIVFLLAHLVVAQKRKKKQTTNYFG